MYRSSAFVKRRVVRRSRPPNGSPTRTASMFPRHGSLRSAKAGDLGRAAPEALRKVKVPVLVLNGRADFANQSIGRLLEVFPNVRSVACDGDHHSTPWEPSFQ